jgi:hypothetical protein
MKGLIDRQPVTGMQQYRAVEREWEINAFRSQAGVKLGTGYRKQSIALKQQNWSSQCDFEAC